jgi:hypothetical protein
MTCVRKLIWLILQGWLSWRSCSSLHDAKKPMLCYYKTSNYNSLRISWPSCHQPQAGSMTLASTGEFHQLIRPGPMGWRAPSHDGSTGEFHQLKAENVPAKRAATGEFHQLEVSWTQWASSPAERVPTGEFHQLTLSRQSPGKWRFVYIPGTCFTKIVGLEYRPPGYCNGLWYAAGFICSSRPPKAEGS